MILIWLHLHRPVPAALVRCYGSGLLALGLRCLSCPDCATDEPGDDVADVPVWPWR